MPTGTVTEFDAAKGLGTVVDDDGVAFQFHLVEIADGSRTIDVGQPVHFEQLPRFGRYQAAKLHKV